MDVGNPSNFERLQKIYSGIELSQKVEAHSVSDEQIRRQIQKVKKDFNEVICPHTATAFEVAQKFQSLDLILVATAHPAKFDDIVEPLIREKIAVPANLEHLLLQPSTNYEIEPELSELLREVLIKF